MSLLNPLIIEDYFNLSQKLTYFFPTSKLYNYFEDSNYVYLVLEMCHSGEMTRYLKERKMPFSEDEGQPNSAV